MARMQRRNSSRRSKPLQPHQHVVPRGDEGWAVIPEGGEKASRVFSSKLKAIRYAHQLADRNDVGMVIHNKDGSVERFDSPPHYPSFAADILHLR